MTPDLLNPRRYQEECIADLDARFAAGAVRVPNVLATGLGKTVIFAHLIKREAAANPGRRILVLVHTDELVQQAVAKIQKVAPHLNIGIVKAAVNQVTARVIVGSVQTLRNAKRRAQLRNVGLIIVDECHHAVAPTYRGILEHFGAFDEPSPEPFPLAGESPAEYQAAVDAMREAEQPRVKVAGFTATLARGDKQKLSDVWEECTFSRDISFGIRRGYLLDVRGKRIIIADFDLSKVATRGGDYAEGALADELERAFAPERIAEEYVKHASDRKGLAFWPTVATAEHGARAFNEAGIPSAVIHGGLGQLERRLILKRLASGEIQCVHNCAVLTEGFDDPTISCVVIARPTRSAPLYQQMIGRGLRPDLSLPVVERGDCLVMDCVGASAVHGLRSLIDLSERRIPEELWDEELSLIELEELAEAEEQRLGDGPGFPKEIYNGETAAVDFDPLGRTTGGAWIRTQGGSYFVPCGDNMYVFLAPSEEGESLYDVVWVTKSRGVQRDGAEAGLTEHRGLPLDMATSWAEEVMTELGGDMAKTLGDAKRPWRRQQPSEKQKAWAERRRIDIEGMRKGEVADLMTAGFASARIDPIVAAVLAERESAVNVS